MVISTRRQSGFTIVELLIVIVIIGILAAITIVAYNGIQQRARDSQRASDLTTLNKALELYYIDNGEYPPSPNGSTSMSANWSTTADASWQNLATYLVPKYISKLPSDPISTPNKDITSVTSSYGYAYYANPNGTYCGVGAKQFYIVVYRFEATSQKNDLSGACSGSTFGPYSGASNYRVVK